MIPQIVEWLNTAGEVIKKAGFSLDKTKEIPYGVQLIVERQGASLPVNIYYSKKRGISVVFGGSPGSQLRMDLERLVDSLVPDRHLHMPFASWVGTDEAGKGDYFGPLVVAGVLADKETAHILVEMGVKDSKSLSNARVSELGLNILRRFSDRVNIVEILPHRYNSIMEKIQKEGKNLNHLLGWAHARVLENLMKLHSYEAALVDRFGDEKYLKEALVSMNRIKLMLVPRAERNPAVAAASILARDRFLTRIKELEKVADREIFPGAGDNVKTAAQDIFNQGGREKLACVAKLHFVITKKLK